jgi:hypothetical protein
MSPKFEPVAWLTFAAVVVGALLQADAEAHLLPAAWARWLAFFVLVIGLIVAGVKARGTVTPLADPRNEEGKKLYPSATLVQTKRPVD